MKNHGQFGRRLSWVKEKDKDKKKDNKQDLSMRRKPKADEA